jgi:citrate lyase alpha subunit
MNINHIEITQINGIIAKATIEELRMLNETIINTIKYKRNLESSAKKVGLAVGMTVRVNHPKLAGQELSVNKINRTKATLSIKSGKCFVVPISLIEY